MIVWEAGVPEALEICDKCEDKYLRWQSANHRSICEGE